MTSWRLTYAAGESTKCRIRRGILYYTKADVDAVLSVSAFRLGWKFYVYRISEYFGSDWDDVCQVIIWYKENRR